MIFAILLQIAVYPGQQVCSAPRHPAYGLACMSGEFVAAERELQRKWVEVTTHTAIVSVRNGAHVDDTFGRAFDASEVAFENYRNAECSAEAWTPPGPAGSALNRDALVQCYLRLTRIRIQELQHLSELVDGPAAATQRNTPPGH
jgi:uncharacterized protein YecT (DUF1311 family)